MTILTFCVSVFLVDVILPYNIFDPEGTLKINDKGYI